MGFENACMAKAVNVEMVGGIGKRCTIAYHYTTHTFLWYVPSSDATTTVLPKLAISSQNSTVSGNWLRKKKGVGKKTPLYTGVI